MMYHRGVRRLLQNAIRENMHYGSKASNFFICPIFHKVHPCKSQLSYSCYQQVRLVQLCTHLSNIDKPPENTNNPQISPSTKSRIKEAMSKVMPKIKQEEKVEITHHSTERNFITAVRAMSEFLLKPSDLENLRKTKRRSPFENEPPITVYWRKDVEEKAVQVWGSLLAIDIEKMKRERQKKESNHIDIFNLKRLVIENRRVDERRFPSPADKKLRRGLDSSGKVVWAAVAINTANLGMKLGAWCYTGSHSLFAEVLHSLADVTNQLILAYGIHKSTQQADASHPYGYTTMRYVSSLISGAMIFCMGAGLSFHHGISGLLNPSEVVPMYWAFFILGGSLVSEGGTLLMAINAIKKGAIKQQMSFKEYVMRGNDPSVNVVLLEDAAAVMGVTVAMACMGLTSFTGSHIPDALGSCIIGTILAGVSGFLVYTNSAALVGKSIPRYQLGKINEELEMDVMIRAIHDVKGIDMGTGLVRYKAEVDFDGREITAQYLEKYDLELLLKEMQSMKSTEEVEEFLKKHGENIVDSLGAEVDRIEKSLRKSHPEIRHCDLEIL